MNNSVVWDGRSHSFMDIHLLSNKDGSPSKEIENCYGILFFSKDSKLYDHAFIGDTVTWNIETKQYEVIRKQHEAN